MMIDGKRRRVSSGTAGILGKNVAAVGDIFEQGVRVQREQRTIMRYL
jgi:hypothetical protein